MSEQTTPVYTGSGGQLKTLAVRITEDLRAQLDIIAQLTGRSATEEIRLALEHWIDRTKSDPAVLKKAEAVRRTSSATLRPAATLSPRSSAGMALPVVAATKSPIDIKHE